MTHPSARWHLPEGREKMRMEIEVKRRRGAEAGAMTGTRGRRSTSSEIGATQGLTETRGTRKRKKSGREAGPGPRSERREEETGAGVEKEDTDPLANLMTGGRTGMIIRTIRTSIRRARELKETTTEDKAKAFILLILFILNGLNILLSSKVKHFQSMTHFRS